MVCKSRPRAWSWPKPPWTPSSSATPTLNSLPKSSWATSNLLPIPISPASAWESGQDVSSRFGPQQTGGTIIQHVRHVDLQASMAQAATILARWATLLAQERAPATEVSPPATALDLATEGAWWQQVANAF